jgi:hypothetical protein
VCGDRLVAMTFDATLKDMGWDSPRGFLAYLFAWIES